VTPNTFLLCHEKCNFCGWQGGHRFAKVLEKNSFFQDYNVLKNQIIFILNVLEFDVRDPSKSLKFSFS